MIYFGRTAHTILENNLHDNADIFAKGYFKNENTWIAFDNYSGDCFVEEFSKKEEAIAWIADCFEMSEFDDFKILKIFKGLYYVPNQGFLKVKVDGKTLTNQIIKWPSV